MPKEEYRYYMNFRKVVHRRAESSFKANAKLEKVYYESFKRVNGMDDLTPFVDPKPKAKSKTSKKKK